MPADAGGRKALAGLCERVLPLERDFVATCLEARADGAAEYVVPRARA